MPCLLSFINPVAPPAALTFAGEKTSPRMTQMALISLIEASHFLVTWVHL